MAQTEINDISADSSLVDPEKDLLGHANFAKYLAESICRMSYPEGFVIAVYGSWNSGKSTLLNFVVHYLQQKPEEEKPIIVPFNPWLFSGHQNITRRFFDQLKNVLSQESSVPKGLKERVADFAAVISDIPLPYAQTGKALVALLDDKDKEAGELKEEVEDTLAQQQRRIVITIDDIDRLAAEDIKQLFRIFKAMRNFTNIVYLLVFNKEVVMKTIADTKEISEEAYLEQIIQVSFELPNPDKTSLRRLLFEKLDYIFSQTSKQQINQTRWGDIYFQGIEHFITNIRDITRFINTLTVTYPAVKDEINPVDFLAIESLRVFCPKIYSIIHQNPHIFVGEVNLSIDELKNLLNTWIAQLRDEDKQPVKNLLIHLFPKLKFILGNTSLDEKQLEWREQLRVCSLEIFPIYFRLSLSAGELSNIQIKIILGLVENIDKFRNYLIELTKQKLPNGTTQARVFIEQLENSTEEIPVNYIPSVVEALFDVSEQLLSQDDESHSILAFSNEVIISRCISQLLCQINETSRFELLKKVITQGKALPIINHEIAILKEQQSQYGTDKSNYDEKWLVNAQHLKKLEEMTDSIEVKTDTNYE
ncbi:KAP P-loop domain-containing protein [Nostoc commune NIES-4072]|uniref:KAP P-loop domain-containing protein n=1 Tax=Nostoc commune NIES-4072 TaxID=2005467 RepID=A0A2R5FSZ2_NOSCO|nr:P-loop NTPase fold protein [Nostoc commune]BBD68408.1 KAP P-loop domain-containing protein [Nostoc commune HK-02]GBG20598.1 KAP P-loop domain-containing protein [Nostoc commune NIES-4072]